VRRAPLGILWSAFFVACHSDGIGAKPGQATSLNAAVETVHETLDAAAACPAIDASMLAEVALDVKSLAAKPPDIVDEKHVLAHFYGRLAEIARGTATDHVHIGVYGDSNMTMDYITGQMRRTLATRFGDAGHGFVALTRPWPWYVHMDVRHDLELKEWKVIATSTNQVGDGLYGFANMAAETGSANAVTWVATARDDAPIGKSVEHFDIYYLKKPNGGSFKIKLDGKVDRTISTASLVNEAAFEKIDVADGPHKLEVVSVGDGRVRVYGTTMERAPEPGKYGILVDSLGVGALNFEQMQHVESKTRVAMLSHRKYDLVLFLLGTNMFVPSLHAKWVGNVLKDFREALPECPIMILTPPDIVLHGTDEHSDPRIVNLVKQFKKIAADENAAYFDFWSAMGGDASIKKFAKMGLANYDYVHLTSRGGAIMGDRLVYALFHDLQNWIAQNPDAGCAGH